LKADLVTSTALPVSLKSVSNGSMETSVHWYELTD
jgi:hypothetical protein